MPTPRTFEMVKSMLSILGLRVSVTTREWIVRCRGFCTTATADEVKRIAAMWKEMSEPNMPTLHMFMNRKGW